MCSHVVSATIRILLRDCATLDFELRPRVFDLDALCSSIARKRCCCFGNRGLAWQLRSFLGRQRFEAFKLGDAFAASGSCGIAADGVGRIKTSLPTGNRPGERQSKGYLFIASVLQALALSVFHAPAPRRGHIAAISRAPSIAATPLRQPRSLHPALRPRTHHTERARPRRTDGGHARAPLRVRAG